MQVVEKFTSINGEGSRAGELAVFIRFRGCNLSCGYCDTTWANEEEVPFVEMTPEEIAAYIQSTGIRNVTLTGGEPLLQKRSDMLWFLELLRSDGFHRVEIETNGSVDLRPYCREECRPVFTMDWKLPSSGSEEMMLPGNLELLSSEDTVKFVVGTEEDLRRAAALIGQYYLTERCHVYLGSVFGQMPPERIVEFMTEYRMNDARLQLQMHKIIWEPDRRGV